LAEKAKTHKGLKYQMMIMMMMIPTQGDRAAEKCIVVKLTVDTYASMGVAPTKYYQEKL
jgi:hypothetical protein